MDNKQFQGFLKSQRKGISMLQSYQYKSVIGVGVRRQVKGLLHKTTFQSQDVLRNLEYLKDPTNITQIQPMLARTINSYANYLKKNGLVIQEVDNYHQSLRDTIPLVDIEVDEKVQNLESVRRQFQKDQPNPLRRVSYYDVMQLATFNDGVSSQDSNSYNGLANQIIKTIWSKTTTTRDQTISQFQQKLNNFIDDLINTERTNQQSYSNRINLQMEEERSFLNTQDLQDKLIKTLQQLYDTRVINRLHHQRIKEQCLKLQDCYTGDQRSKVINTIKLVLFSKKGFKDTLIKLLKFQTNEDTMTKSVIDYVQLTNTKIPDLFTTQDLSVIELQIDSIKLSLQLTLVYQYTAQLIVNQLVTALESNTQFEIKHWYKLFSQGFSLPYTSQVFTIQTVIFFNTKSDCLHWVNTCKQLSTNRLLTDDLKEIQSIGMWDWIQGQTNEKFYSVCIRALSSYTNTNQGYSFIQKKFQSTLGQIYELTTNTSDRTNLRDEFKKRLQAFELELNQSSVTTQQTIQQLKPDNPDYTLTPFTNKQNLTNQMAQLLGSYIERKGGSYREFQFNTNPITLSHVLTPTEIDVLSQITGYTIFLSPHFVQYNPPMQEYVGIDIYKMKVFLDQELQSSGVNMENENYTWGWVGFQTLMDDQELKGYTKELVCDHNGNFKHQQMQKDGVGRLFTSITKNLEHNKGKFKKN